MSQQAFFDALVALLNQAAIPFMVTGSYGSSHYGMPRTTNDLDLVIDPTPEQLDALCALVGNRFYLSSVAAREALQTRFLFNIIDVAGGCKADLIIRKARPFSAEEFSRRRALPLHGTMVHVASPEDIILSKLEWNKITPCERQVQDALDVAIISVAEIGQGLPAAMGSRAGGRGVIGIDSATGRSG
jgi:hypothetical protein